MATYARFNEYQVVKLKVDRPNASEHPITELRPPRQVTTSDRGVIVEVYDVEHPGYEVEFFDAHGKTIDLLTLSEDEIESWQ